MPNKKLDELRKQIVVCTKCRLSEGRTHAVPGEGNSKADIVFVGEGPGYYEDQQGKPFVGQAGQFLNELLESIGLDRNDVFITNLVKCRPPQNRDPEPIEVDTCTSLYLEKQIDAMNPKVIVTLGRHALREFLPDVGSISQVHGKVYRKGKRYLVALYHPAAALHQGNLKEQLKKDFQVLTKVRKKI